MSQRILSLKGLKNGFYHFTVEKYHQMIDAGILNEKSRVELIRGHLVQKMSRNPPHDSTLHRLNRWLNRVVPSGWEPREQMAITLYSLASEPEPDLAIVRGNEDTYSLRHPGPGDFGILIEVADSTLTEDRVEGQSLYAECGIPEFWIVNIPDRQIEVYSEPSGPGAMPAYSRRTDYPMGSVVPLILDGTTIAMLKVDDVMPR